MVSPEKLFDYMMILYMFIATIWLVISVIVLIKVYARYTKTSLNLVELENSNKDNLINYSSELLDFIKLMISQVALLKVKEFLDGNDISKVTRVHIENIISEVATDIKNRINMNNVSIENTIYTKEFFDQYIVDTTVYIVKQLFEEAIVKSDIE